MEKIIELKNIIKTYSTGDININALNNVSVSVYKGEFIAIMGASGSGKSTLMNILGCLDKATNGDYLLDGINVSGMTNDQYADIRSQKIGFVFQGFNLLSRTTALDNVLMPLLYNNTKKDKLQMHEKALNVLTKVGLKDRLHHAPNKLSGGQQQRVAIARSIVNDPQIILADEPTGNLDSVTSVEIMALFQEFNNNGITVILVTHEPDIAIYARRKILMKDGMIVEDRIQKKVLIKKRDKK